MLLRQLLGVQLASFSEQVDIRGTEVLLRDSFRHMLRNADQRTLPIRLLPTPPTCRVLPRLRSKALRRSVR